MTTLTEIRGDAGWHFSPLLVARAWVALCERLHDPVAVREEKGMRVVEVLGCLRYLVMPTARRVHFAYATGRGRFRVGPSGGTVALAPTLLSDQWLALFLANWLVNRGAQVAPHAFTDFESELRAEPAYAQLLDRVKACRVTEKLREVVAAALALDAQVLADARAGFTHREEATVDSRHYGTVWQRAESFDQLRCENPRLVRTYAGAALARQLGNHPEPVRDLKLALRRAGVDDPGWKALLAADPAMLEAACPGAKNPIVFWVHAWALKACAAMGRVAPPAVMGRLVSPNGRKPGERRTLSANLLDEGFWPPFLRALGRRLAAVEGEAALRAFLDGEFEDVYDWLEWEEPALDANQARAGWAWMLREHRRWEERERQRALRERENLRWPVPVREFVFEGWRVTALADSYELWEEGQAMRHCARTYAAHCQRGVAILFSIRDAEGRRVATGGIDRREGAWRAGSVRLFGNRPAGPDLWRVARAFAEACNFAGSSVIQPGTVGV